MKGTPDKDKDHGQFNESSLYHQLLYRRKAQPIGMISVMVKYAWWGLILAPALMAQNMFLSSIFMVAVFLVPLFVSLSTLLWFLPLSFNKDLDSGGLGLIFASPVPSSDIVRSLRRFYGYQGIKILIPLLVVFGFFNLGWYFVGLPDNGLVELSEFFRWALVWWFLLECSIAATSFSKEFALTGVVIIALVVPILLAVYFLGTFVADSFWYGFRGDDIVEAYKNSERMIVGMNPNFLAMKMENVLSNCMQGFFLLIPLLVLFRENPRLMDLNRAGRW